MSHLDANVARSAFWWMVRALSSEYALHKRVHVRCNAQNSWEEKKDQFHHPPSPLFYLSYFDPLLHHLVSQSIKSVVDVIDSLPCSRICLSPNRVPRLSIYFHFSSIRAPPFGGGGWENDWTICCVMLWWEIKFIDWIRSSSLGIGDHFNHVPNASTKKRLVKDLGLVVRMVINEADWDLGRWDVEAQFHSTFLLTATSVLN